MKVCTDACLLGAYAAAQIEKFADQPGHILDIGTGTGLLALMLAQKTTGLIDAVEMNEAAAGQAKENMSKSPWATRLTVYNSSIQNFSSKIKYDFIISNPPFFEDDLRSQTPQKNDAKHDTGLSLQELINAIAGHLSAVGLACILLPYHRTDYFFTLAQKAGLFPKDILLVKQTPQHAFFRSIVLLNKESVAPKETVLTIHEQDRQYSPGFTALLKDYYLKL